MIKQPFPPPFGDECSPSPTHKFHKEPQKQVGLEIHTADDSTRNAVLGYSHCEMWLGSTEGVPWVYAAGHMHAMHRHQSSSRGSNMIWVTMSVFLFTYSRKWATDCKSKENRVLQRHEVGEGTPEDFQEWCTTFFVFFATMTCSDVHKLIFFFLG